MATVSNSKTFDSRNWNEEAYRKSILMEREQQSRTVFRTVFAPSSSTNPENLVVASSDGSITTYSLSSCISSATKPINLNKKRDQLPLAELPQVQPFSIIKAHKGPTYDLKFYGEGEDSLLLSCGDDGRIRGWRWLDVLNSEFPISKQGRQHIPVLDFVNPQHEGPWESRSPIPENNAIAVNKQDGSIFSATGDACAYSWDMETGKIKMAFKGHLDYLHCIVSRNTSNQIITGSEDGTARVWDCRSGLCTRIIDPKKGRKSREDSWISSVALDASESWLVCGSSLGLSVWSAVSYDCIFEVDTHAPVQDLLFDDSQVLAVGSEPLLTRYSLNGNIISKIQCAPCSAFSISLHPSRVAAIGGYGGLVDVISEFGSHLCVFSCQGLMVIDDLALHRH